MSAKIIFVALCAVFGFAFAHDEEMMKVSDQCLAKLEMDKDAFTEWFHKRPVETDDPKYKCYFKCILKETKWMDENGNILDKPEAKVDEDLVSFGQQCRTDVMGSDECEKAFNFHKCLVEKKEGQ